MDSGQQESDRAWVKKPHPNRLGIRLSDKEPEILTRAYVNISPIKKRANKLISQEYGQDSTRRYFFNKLIKDIIEENDPQYFTTMIKLTERTNPTDVGIFYRDLWTRTYDIHQKIWPVIISVRSSSKIMAVMNPMRVSILSTGFMEIERSSLEYIRYGKAYKIQIDLNDPPWKRFRRVIREPHPEWS